MIDDAFFLKVYAQYLLISAFHRSSLISNLSNDQTHTGWWQCVLLLFLLGGKNIPHV